MLGNVGTKATSRTTPSWVGHLSRVVDQGHVPGYGFPWPSISLGSSWGQQVKRLKVKRLKVKLYGNKPLDWRLLPVRWFLVQQQLQYRLEELC